MSFNEEKLYECKSIVDVEKKEVYTSELSQKLRKMPLMQDIDLKTRQKKTHAN